MNISKAKTGNYSLTFHDISIAGNFTVEKGNLEDFKPMIRGYFFYYYYYYYSIFVVCCRCRYFYLGYYWIFSFILNVRSES